MENIYIYIAVYFWQSSSCYILAQANSDSCGQMDLRLDSMHPSRLSDQRSCGQCRKSLSLGKCLRLRFGCSLHGFAQLGIARRTWSAFVISCQLGQSLRLCALALRQSGE